MPYKKFTNFERYFNANRDAAEGEANKLYEQQRKQAEATQNATNQLSNQFAQRAGFGTHDALQGRPQQRPATNVGAGAVPNVGMGSQRPMEATNANMGVRESSVPTLDEQIAAADKMAQTTYTGPANLIGVEGWNGVADQVLKTRSELDSLGSGSGIQALNAQLTGRPMTSGESRFGAGLVGSAGRGKFDRLRAEFNPQGEWDAAVKKADTQAAQAAEKAKREAASGKAYAEELRNRRRVEAEDIRNSDLLAEAEGSPTWSREATQADIEAKNVARSLKTPQKKTQEWDEFIKSEEEFQEADGLANRKPRISRELYALLRQNEADTLAKLAKEGRQDEVHKYIKTLQQKYGVK